MQKSTVGWEGGMIQFFLSGEQEKKPFFEGEIETVIF